MGQLRRKVHNYTILVLIKEGSMPDFHVKSLAALRVREGAEVDSLCFQDCDQKERQAIAKDMKALHAFLADDLILTADISENMPAMEKLYQEYCDAFFTNTTLDILPINEEVTPLMDDPAAFKARIAASQGETDALKRARSTHAIYEEAAEILYGYQKGWPYWICALSTEEERGMEKRLPAKKEKTLDRHPLLVLRSALLLSGKFRAQSLLPHDRRRLLPLDAFRSLPPPCHGG